MAWCCDPKGFQDDDPSKPLKEDPDKVRKECLAFSVRYCVALVLKHSTAFALKKNGRMVACATLVPPGAAWEFTLCDWLREWNKIKPYPEAMEKAGAVKNRWDALEALMVKQHKALMGKVGPHWYLHR